MSDLKQKIHQAIMVMENPTFDAIGQVQSRTYPYATLGACLTVVKKACGPLGLSISFGARCDESIGGWCIYTIVSDGENEEWLFPVPCDLKNNMQERGSAITYAKRYSLSGAFALVSEKDDDGDAASNPAPAKKAPARRSPAKQTKKPVPSEKTKAMKQAVDRLNTAMAVFADLHDRNFNDVKDGVKKRPDYVKTPEYLNAVAEEFEQGNEEFQQEKLL